LVIIGNIKLPKKLKKMNNLTFEIKNSKDFLDKLKKDFKDYLDSNNYSRMAINCAMTSWHLTEWIYHEYNFNKKFKKNNYQKHIKKLCPSLQIMHDISNGSKHYKLDWHKPLIEATERKEGPFDHTFDFTFEKTMLRIVLPNNEIVIYDEELKKTINFWENYLNKLS
jgi:hypothetical protein